MSASRVQLKCGDARKEKWRGNWQIVGVASTLHTTSEHGVSSITTADAHTSVAGSRLNWRTCRFKCTRPFRRKTISGFCACAIAFQTQSNDHSVSTKGVFSVPLMQVPEAAHAHFHFSIADELSRTCMPALPQSVSALKYKQFPSSCTAYCCLSGFNLRSTDIPDLHHDGTPYFFFVRGATAPSGSGPPHYRGFTITFRHATIGRTPLDDWSALTQGPVHYDTQLL
jgi:hypothetical protein